MEMCTRGDSAVSLDRVPLAHAASSRTPPLLLSCARLAGWICCWYTISISLTLYNKWFFDIYDFHYPLLVTSLHIAIKMPAARLLMWLLGLPKLHLFDGSCSRLMRIAPTGLTMAADIGCSNLSMLYISITFYTIAKSSVPVWILFFSILLRLDKPRLSVAITVLCIGAGISLASIHPEPDEAGGGRRRLLLLDPAPHHREAAPPRDRTAAALWGADRLAEARGAEWHGVEPLAGGLLPGEPAPRVDFPRLASRPRRRAGGSEAGGGEAGGGEAGGEAGGGEAGGGAAEEWQTSQSTQPPQPPRTPPPPQTSPPPPTPAEEGGEEGSQGSGVAGESESASDFLFGCLLILLASACAGFRWACTHLLLSPDALADPSPADATAASPPPKAGARVHPAVLLYHISPWGLLLLLPIAVALEAGELGRYLGSASSEQMVAVGGLAAVGGCVSFLLLLAEMQVVKLSSALTLSVAGIFKELLTVLCSALLLGDSLTPYNVSGLMLCLLGIAHYTYEGWSRAQGKARETATADARASGAAAAHAWQEGSSAASMTPASERVSVNRPVRLCGASEAAGRGVEELTDNGYKPREDAARV